MQKLDTFTKRKDRYFFHKLSKRYNERDILDYFVSNFAVDSDNWIGDLLTNEGAETYAKYRKYKESFRYHFRDDCVRINDDFARNSAFLLMMRFALIWDNILESYDYLFKGRLTTKPPSIWINILRFLKIGTKLLVRKSYA